MSDNVNTSGASVATLTPKPSVAGDCISDRTLNELIRRLEVTFNLPTTGDIWPGLQPPADKTKIWWPTDPTTGLRIGSPKTWDSVTQQWLVIGQSGQLTPPQRRRRNGVQQIPAGKSSVRIDFEDIGTSSYMVYIAPISIVDNANIPPPGNMNNFAWSVTDRGNGQVVIEFYAVPTGGYSILWEVAEMAGTTDDQTA